MCSISQALTYFLHISFQAFTAGVHCAAGFMQWSIRAVTHQSHADRKKSKRATSGAELSWSLRD
jgi:hypothetical protein